MENQNNSHNEAITTSIERYQALLQYLTEFRRRLFYCVFTMAGVFLVLCFFSNDLYHWLAAPLLKHLPAKGAMIATSITGTFSAPLKLTTVLAVVITIPLFLYHGWAFIAPALYQHERGRVWSLLFVSTLLFYAGMLFAYFVVFPLMFNFFISIAPADVTIMPDINQYLDMTFRLFLAFGAVFEVPVLTLLLIWSGTVSKASLVEKRPYVIVGAFIIGMLITPDVVSQILLAVPLWLLFELGLLMSRFKLLSKPSILPNN